MCTRFVAEDSDGNEMTQQLDPADELRARETLKELLRTNGRRNLEGAVNELMSTEGGFVGRFQYLRRYLEEGHYSRLLISGCSAGSEAAVARNFGFAKIVGTDSDPALIEIAKDRFVSWENVAFEVAHGVELAYATSSFDCVYSGHVVEHTGNPERYLREHLRVLRPGGILFLEFPNRYHWVELHTGTRSLEWLPRGIRRRALSLVAGLLRRRGDAKHALYESVRDTLEPVSVRRVMQSFPKGGRPVVVDVDHPLPGYVRMILRKP